MGYTGKIVIIGAGLSGLTCAFRLKQFGLHPIVLEAMERAGGLIETIRRNGFLFEAGPQCPRFPEPVWALVRELNLEHEFVPGDAKAKRYILRHGRLHRAPFSPGELLTTRLVDFPSKLRVIAEVFGHSSPPAREESLAEFVERKFGSEVLDYLVDPIISTIFFGDSRKMGMESAFPSLVEWERKQGSLVRGALRARKSSRSGARSRVSSKPALSHSSSGNFRVTNALPSLGSFKSGMGALPEKLSEVLKDNIRYGQKIEFIEPSRKESGAVKSGWEIHLQNAEQVTADALVLALPAYAAARLLEKRALDLASLLKGIEYAPACVVSSGFERSKVSHSLDGFGFMVPRRESLETICTFWNSSLFRAHAPEDSVLLTSFAGRDACNDLFTMTEEECAQTVEAENARILGITGSPIDRMVWRSPQALPQYNVGHASRVAEIHEVLRTLPNLYLAGNFLTGRSIGDCVQIASRIAEDLLTHFRRYNIQSGVDSLGGQE
jgi:oxygen-dependent protoporphyrinogen oxidase